LSGEPTSQDLLEVQAHFGLPSPALVEKDWYVVRALTAIAGLKLAGIRLIFGGGTALARAHRVIRRMSEDIDLKIVSDNPLNRTALGKLRDQVTQALLDAGFKFDPNNPEHRKSGNANRYTIFRLPYPAAAAGEGALRPEIQIELGVWPLRRPHDELSMISFVAEASGRAPEIAALACVSITQTAAEKFVALTRRVALELELAEEKRDPTLVRHIYDLHVTRGRYGAGEVAVLAREIMPHDAEVFGNKSAAYNKDPIAETLRAIEAIATQPYYARQYDEFCRYMVYGDQAAYADCLATLADLVERLRV